MSTHHRPPRSHTRLPLAAPRLALLGLLALGLLGLRQATPARAAIPAPAGWTHVWGDDFTGGANTGLNASSWIYDTGTRYTNPDGAPNWGTGEIGVHTSSTANVYLTGAGQLAIRPLHSGTDPLSGWTSGRVETVRADFEPPAGGIMRVEARIQLPSYGATEVAEGKAQGIWPAFWMLGAPFRASRAWPSGGEFDIMENVDGANMLWGTLHCGVEDGGPCNEKTGLGDTHDGFAPRLQDDFHVYRLEFDKSVSPQELRWYVDDYNYHTVRADQVDATTWSNATNRGSFIILNVAVGGGWPGDPTAATVPGRPMLVDYVAVWTRGGAAQPTATSAGGSGCGTTNVALNRPASASSGGAGYEAARAVDGSAATRWGSAYADPQWIQVDLGATLNICQARLSWEGAYGKDYQVQVSGDGAGWTTIRSVTSGDGGIDDLTSLAGSGRYVRVYGTARGTTYGYSLWELELYAASAPAATATRTSTPASAATATRTSTSTPAPGGGATLKVRYMAQNTNAGDGSIDPHFIIANTGTGSVPLSELKLRYYRTKEGAAPEQYWCDWAQVGCGAISASFQAGYVEFSFGSAAGSLPSGGSSGEIKHRFNKSDWSNYNEANDYSFDPTRTSYADWSRVTLYRNGVRVWGVEP